jgi:hypothetical protein
MKRTRADADETLRVGCEVKTMELEGTTRGILTLTANPDRCAVSSRRQTQCSPAQADR